MNDQLLMSSAAAARFLKVGESTIKRWADEGGLLCVRTSGGHRRFSREVLEEFRRFQKVQVSAETQQLDVTQHLLEMLLTLGTPLALEARLLSERARLGSWWRVADGLSDVVHTLHSRRASGALSLLDEHLASERMTRALLHLGSAMPVSEDAPRALFCCAEGDEQTLPLSLAELSLKELGWHTLWPGRRTPMSAVAAASASHGLSLIVLSASERARDVESLLAQSVLVGRACRLHGVALLLIGSGPWPEQPAFGHTVRDHRMLRHAVTQIPAV